MPSWPSSAGDLAGRHAQPLAEPGRQRHRPGTKLRSRRAERVGGLRGVAGLDPPAAHAAAADLDLVAGHQRPGRRQLLLVLHRHPFQRQLPAAAGTASRQPHLNDLVDLRWSAPVGAGAVGRAGLAPRPLGMGRGVALENGAAWRLAARRNASTSPRSRSLSSWSRSRSARSRSFSPRSRSRSASSRCCSSRNPAFSSSSRARRQRNPPGPAGARPVCIPLATIDMRPESYNRRPRRQGPAI